MKTLVAIFRKFAKGPLVADEPKRRERSLAPIADSWTGTSGMSSSDRPVVKKSAGERNSFVAIGSSVFKAGSSAFNGMESRSSDETSTGMVTLRAATSAMLVAWGTSSTEAIVVWSATVDVATELGAACGKAKAVPKSVVEMIAILMVDWIGGEVGDCWSLCLSVWSQCNNAKRQGS
jgi:hypothetical protein